MQASDQILWVDVRTPEEFNAGHFDGAINIPCHELVHHMDKLDVPKEMRIHVYCRKGVRSGIAKSIFESYGFNNVHNIGGLEDLPVDDG